jgi:hypothetical protein
MAFSRSPLLLENTNREESDQRPLTSAKSSDTVEPTEKDAL